MKEIILTLGQSALVDDDWYWRLRSRPWYAKLSAGGFYAATSLSRKNGYHHLVLRMHRLILGLVPRDYCQFCNECNVYDECAYSTSCLWEGHHNNGDTMDNRITNLEKITVEEHRRITFSGGSILRPKPLRPASRFIGVRWNLERGKWQASWKSGNGEYVIGFYTDDVSAALAYDCSASRLLGGKVKLNWPEGAADTPF